MLAHKQSESKIHLYCRDILIGYLYRGLIVGKGSHFVPELGDFVHNLSKSESPLLILDLLEILDDRLYEVGGIGALEGIERLHARYIV